MEDQDIESILRRGRPPIPKTEEVIETILALVVAGWSLKRICALEDMPSLPVFFRWLQADEVFRARYVRAKEDQADVFVEEMLEIADNNENDISIDPKDETKKRIEYANIQRAKLRVDTRRWIASKFKANKYGDRVIHAGDEEAPLVTKEVSQSDRKILERFVQNYGDRAVKPKEKPYQDDGSDLV